MAQNDKRFCLSHSVSQEPYIIWLWFLVHMCKMIISPANFFTFQNFDFWGFQGGKRVKNDLKLPISVCFALYFTNYRSYHRDFDNDILRCAPPSSHVCDFLIMWQAWGEIIKDKKFCEIIKSTYFEEHLRTAASAIKLQGEVCSSIKKVTLLGSSQAKWEAGMLWTPKLGLGKKKFVLRYHFINCEAITWSVSRSSSNCSSVIIRKLCTPC